MLAGDFFEIVSIQELSLQKPDAEKYQVLFKINPSHPVFNGHFPDQPVVPGATLVEIIKECTEKIKNTAFYLTEASNIKFLKVIIPQINDTLETEITIIRLNQDEFKIQGCILDEEHICMKFDGVFRKKKVTDNGLLQKIT